MQSKHGKGHAELATHQVFAADRQLPASRHAQQVGRKVTAVAHQSQTPDPTTSSDVIYSYIIFQAYLLSSPPGSSRT